MNDGERLAAYLVGDLDPAARRELEARLERDPSLRARLEAIRRADDALASLPEVEPRQAFSEQLRDDLRAELRTQTAGRQTASTDELAERRGRRERSRGLPAWMPALAGAAAVLALFAVVGVGLSSMGGDDEGLDTATLESGEAGGDAGVAADSAQAPAGPVIVALDRDYTSDDVASVIDEPVIQSVLGLDPAQARTQAQEYSSLLGVEQQRAEEDAAAPAEGGDGEAVGAAEAQPEELAPLVQGEATDEELAAVQRCLPQLFEEAGTLVPVYAEIADFEGEPAIVYGLVGEDPQTGTFTQAEVWVVARDSCEVRYFTQS